MIITQNHILIMFLVPPVKLIIILCVCCLTSRHSLYNKTSSLYVPSTSGTLFILCMSNIYRAPNWVLFKFNWELSFNWSWNIVVVLGVDTQFLINGWNHKMQLLCNIQSVHLVKAGEQEFSFKNWLVISRYTKLANCTFISFYKCKLHLWWLKPSTSLS